MKLLAEAVFNLDLSPPAVAFDDEVADVAAVRVVDDIGDIYEVAEMAEAGAVGVAYEVAESAEAGVSGESGEAYEVAELAEARSGGGSDEVAEMVVDGAGAVEGVEEHAVEVDGIIYVPSRRLVELIEARLAYINGKPDFLNLSSSHNYFFRKKNLRKFIIYKDLFLARYYGLPLPEEISDSGTFWLADSLFLTFSLCCSCFIH